MTKRNKANTPRTRPTRGGHLLGPPREAKAAPATVASPPASVDPTTLVLAAECLVADAGALKDSLAGRLDEPLPVILDITALQRIDTAGLQVLTAFIRERAGHDRTVEWRGAAPALTSAAHLLGLTSLLRLPA